MDEVLGHQKVVMALEPLLQKKSFLSSSIFSGPEGIGKKRRALAIAQELNCEKTPACGKCHSCLRIATTPFEVVKWIECLNEKIKTEQIQEVLDFVAHTSWVSHRVIVVDGAEKLTASASNLLLKTLEETPQQVHFIFVTSQISQILPTIRSRCQVVSFSPLSDEELAKIYPQSLPWQRHWSGGRASLLQKIMDADWLELRKLAINFIHGSHKNEILKAMVEAFSQPDRVEFVVHCWQSYVRDAVVKKLNAETVLYNSDIESFVDKFSQHPSLFRIYDLMSEARRDSQAFVDKNLILENLSFQLN